MGLAEPLQKRSLAALRREVESRARSKADGSAGTRVYVIVQEYPSSRQRQSEIVIRSTRRRSSLDRALQRGGTWHEAEQPISRPIAAFVARDEFQRMSTLWHTTRAG
jgi:hypothetical protein